MRICNLIKPELDYYLENCNFNEEETEVFRYLSKKDSYAWIAQELGASTATVGRMARNIREKMKEADKMKNNSSTVPIWQKANLTIEEAAEYSNIGKNKIRSLMASPGCGFVLRIGNKLLIKRKLFEQYLEKSEKI